MVDFLRAFHLWRVVREVLVDSERKGEDAALVHAFIRFDCQGKVKDVVRIRKVCVHCGAEGQFREICIEDDISRTIPGQGRRGKLRPF